VSGLVLTALYAYLVL